MFEDDNTIVCSIPVQTSFNMLQKPSSSKACFDFGLSSSLDESEVNENQLGKNITSPHLQTTIDCEQENIT